MAQTWTKGPLIPLFPQGANLTFASVYLPEGASQTFVANDVVTVTSGYVVLGAAAAAVNVCGVVMEAGHNASAGDFNVRVVPALPGTQFYANLLGSSAADEVLAATDLFLSYELERSTTLIKGTDPGWYINGDVTTTPACKVVNFFADSTFMPTGSPFANEARVGDTNARVVASWLQAETQYTDAT